MYLSKSPLSPYSVSGDIISLSVWRILTQRLSCFSSSSAEVWVIRRRMKPPFSHFLESGPEGKSSSGR